MIRIRKKGNGQATIEQLVLITLIIAALFVFQRYIAQGFAGRWKNTGDTFGFGGQYDPDTTVECGYYPPQPPSYFGNWYNSLCFDEVCTEDCLGLTATYETCSDCLFPDCYIAICGDE